MGRRKPGPKPKGNWLPTVGKSLRKKPPEGGWGAEDPERARKQKKPNKGTSES